MMSKKRMNDFEKELFVRQQHGHGLAGFGDDDCDEEGDFEELAEKALFAEMATEPEGPNPQDMPKLKEQFARVRAAEEAGEISPLFGLDAAFSELEESARRMLRRGFAQKAMDLAMYAVQQAAELYAKEDEEHTEGYDEWAECAREILEAAAVLWTGEENRNAWVKTLRELAALEQAQAMNVSTGVLHAARILEVGTEGLNPWEAAELVADTPGYDPNTFRTLRYMIIQKLDGDESAQLYITEYDHRYRPEEVLSEIIRSPRRVFELGRELYAYYPDKVAEIAVRVIEGRAANARNRAAYRAVAEELEQLAEMGPRDEALRLLEAIRDRNPKKAAFREELTFAQRRIGNRQEEHEEPHR